MKVGINGMGRIGRLALRAALGAAERPADDPRAGNRLEVIHLNEIKGGAAATAHLLAFDSVQGKWREDIAAEGLENRYARHARLNQTVRDWACAKGFRLFPREGYGSVTLNCFANTRNVDLVALNKILKSKHALVIDGGYGKLKGKAFRISNMGDETDATIAALLKPLGAALAELGVK